MKTFERAQFIEHQNIRRAEAAKALESSMEKVRKSRHNHIVYINNAVQTLPELYVFQRRLHELAPQPLVAKLMIPPPLLPLVTCQQQRSS